MTNTQIKTPTESPLPHSPEGTQAIWHEFWKTRQNPNIPVIRARVNLTRPEGEHRQFVVETGSDHHFLVDDTAGGTGAKPIELVAAALGACTAFDVITILRGKSNQHVTGYEVRVEAEQAERPPHSFTAVRIHHIISGRGVDPAAVNEAIRIAETKYCAVEAMLKPTAAITTTFGIVNETVGS